MITIPHSYAAHTIEYFGAQGVTWLRELPALVSELSHLWEFSIREPFALSFDYVIAVQQSDGTDAVLKIGVSNEGTRRAIVALRHYDGDGICRMMRSDTDRNAMLLERLRPGAMLSELAHDNDDESTRIGAEVMRTLWQPVPPVDSFRPIAEWFSNAFSRHRAEYGGAGPFPELFFDYAETLANDLLASSLDEVVLHGDLHHYNILSAERTPWLAIDPKGMRGDPGYEVGPFLLNPDQGGVEIGASRLSRRLDIFAEYLRYDRQRLRDWGIAHAVLSACWSADNNGRGWESAIEAGETLRRLPAQ